MSEQQFAKETLPVSIENEMQRSYLEYAMSVIIGRALPDVRDGLKPVHRRVLFAMHEVSNDWNRPYKKSARIVGDVIGKYHPHGDTAIYDTMVRLAQDFSLRYPLVDGQGNFGSIDGDNAAAMRYTEVRMARITHEMLVDIDKETVDFGPNYDGSISEPLILPARIPNLLINGAAGIAVGMATNIPPHNLSEVINACLTLLKNPDTSIDQIIECIPAPDFPTAGFIYGTAGIRQAYLTGRGRAVMRARTHIEEIGRGDRQALIVDELPYQVNKAKLLERISELVRNKTIEGIAELRDESDKSGMRIVIELKRGEISKVILHQLYKHTSLQDTFGINMVALVEGQPKLLNIKQMLDCFLRHRREIVTRRVIFDLKKSRERSHILEGLAVALSNTDKMIALIKAATAPAEAKAALLAQRWPSQLVAELSNRLNQDNFRPEQLGTDYGLNLEGYRLSPTQAQAILEMRLQRLTGLERDKIIDEYNMLINKIADLLDILSDSKRITQIIVDELNLIKSQFGDKRRSEIIAHEAEVNIEDLIASQEMIVTLTHSGYIKAQPLEDYQAQHRGGRGKQATATKEDDFIDNLFSANTHDYVLCFSSAGRLYWLKVYELPQGGRTARGKPIVNLLPLQKNERINAILPMKTFQQDQYVFMCTAHGIVKKTPLSDFSRPRSSGIIAIDLDENDFLIDVAITNGSAQIMIFSNAGKAVRFDESEVRATGRSARGVRGMRLQADQKVIAMLVASGEDWSVLTATEKGYGKRTPISDYRHSGRGTQGVIAIDTSGRNGALVAATLVTKRDEIMLITTGGVLIRMRVSEIRQMSRATIGVRLINLGQGEKLSGLEKIAEPDEDA